MIGNYKIITLCGSSRFKDEYNKIFEKLTLSGNIVLSVGVFNHSSDESIEFDSKTKEMLEDIHLRKIDISDEIFVINKDGYIGESTLNEINYAKSIWKPIRYLEPINY
jgi:hypothetical protein